MPFYEKFKLPKFMKKLHLHLQLVNTLSIICPKNIISKQEIKKLLFFSYIYMHLQLDLQNTPSTIYRKKVCVPKNSR